MSEWVVSVTFRAPGDPGLVVTAAEAALTDLDPAIGFNGADRYTVSIGLQGFLDSAITEAIVAVSRAVSQPRIVSVEAVTLDEYDARLALPVQRATALEVTVGVPASANPRHDARLLSALSALRSTHPATSSV